MDWVLLMLVSLLAMGAAFSLVGETQSVRGLLAFNIYLIFKYKKRGYSYTMS